DQKKVEPLLVADVTGSDELVKGAIERIAAKAQQSGAVTRRNQGDIVVLTATAKEKADDQAEQRYCYCVRNGVLVGGESAESVGRALRALSSANGESLAENARIRKQRENFARNARGLADMEAYFDAAQLMKLTAPAAGRGPTLVPALPFGSLAFQAAVARGDFETFVQLTALPAADAKFGATDATFGKALAPEPWVPEAASAYASVNLDVDKAWEILVAQLETSQPGAIAALERVAAEFPNKANPLITNIKSDVIEPLGNRISVVADRAGANSPLRFALAWQVRKSDSLGRLLDGVYNQFGPAFKLDRKDVKGVAVYALPAPPRTARRSPLPFEIGAATFAVSRTHLFLGTHVELVERLLNYEGQPGLAENAAAGRVAAKFPAAPNGILYIKPEEYGRVVYGVVKGGALSQLVANLTKDDPNLKEFAAPFVEALKGENLPEFEALKKHFRFPGGGYFASDDKEQRNVIYSVR
ncbi:MAG TPA: hypothetical protein VNC50_14410, partial [Planctomycetia bacterium]|nr:hypothetical protein [Planctomycetia bacterium]